MKRHNRLLGRSPKTLDEKYFHDIRPTIYLQHATHKQDGVRTGTTLAEHLDSVCQFVLTVSRIAEVPEEKRGLILAAAAVHDLNKLDSAKRSVKTLARNRDFLLQQLDLACVKTLVSNDEDLELVRRLIERHSGHHSTDGRRFFPEKDEIERWAAMLIGADLFDLGIPEDRRIRKVETELTVAFRRPTRLFRIRITKNLGYLTALLLNASQEVLRDYGLNSLAIFPDGEIFEGESWPGEEVVKKIASRWQKKVDGVVGGNVEELVKATKDGIKVDSQAVELNPEEALVWVRALLEKKKAGFKIAKVEPSINKWGEKAGDEAAKNAEKLGLIPVSNAEEFAISEALKTAYLSYRQAGLETTEVWDTISTKVGLSEPQRLALEPFDSQYGKSLFAAKAISGGIEVVIKAIEDSFKLRGESRSPEGEIEVSQGAIAAVSQILNLPHPTAWKGINELEAYINSNPRKRNSLSATSGAGEDLISNNMPPGTKVQSFSNRLPGGSAAEPKRQADSLTSLAYKLMKIGANFPAVDKQEPLYLHLALPPGSSPELLRIWREFLKKTARTNAEGGTVTVDESQLYRDNVLEFKSNKVVGLALPKRPDFVRSTVVIPLVWGEVNASVALLKSLRLALELSLSLELGFPFVISSNLETESCGENYGRVEGIPSALQPLLGNGEYDREEATKVRDKLRCIGNLTFCVSSPQKRDDCLYDLARAARRSLDLYYVLLRWVLREQESPNFEAIWNRISQPLTTLEKLMNEETKLTEYLREAARIAEEAKLRGSSFRRTSQGEPFADFMAAIRSRKSHLPWDVVFASLVQQYHTRLHRIREHGVGATKFEKVKEFYDVLRKIFDEVYNSRAERILADKKTLEAAYLFFLQEARQELKP
ncbi:MAG: HD domain-containing protein [Cyanobacteriota bacterium]|nr:HD domain-containing protein [Cyanobacteriota bacterium]